MASICNYSHPELQITVGLERHGGGTLFPYNPEFYELASGLYGPGTIWTWHLLFASVAVHWLAGPRDSNDGRTHPGLSTDLLAVVAYPAFAATDMVIQAVRLIGTDYRALAIFCLRNPIVELNGFVDSDAFSHTQLNLTAGIPPDILSLGQRVIEITGPLAVCYLFCAVCFVLALSLMDGVDDMVPWRPTSAAKRYLFGGYVYVLLALVVFHFSLGDFGITIFISVYEGIQPFLNAMTFGMTLFCGGSFLMGIIYLGVSLANRDWPSALEAAKAVGSSILLAAFFPVWMIYFTIKNQILIVPDLAVTIDERDQLAALIAGTMTLVYTMYTAIRERRERRRQLTDVEMEERQGLNTGQEQLPDEPQVLEQDQRASTF